MTRSDRARGRPLYAVAGAIAIGLALAAGFGGMLLMLVIELHEVLTWVGELCAPACMAMRVE